MLKRGARIEYTYAAGKVVAGRVLGAEKIPSYSGIGSELWYRTQLLDERGAFKGLVHSSQVRSIDNR